MITTLAILVVTALCFAWGRVRADLVAICSALGLVLTGVLTPEEALTGFSTPLVVMMGGLFIVGGGIFGTGLAKRLGEGILGLAGGRETRIFVLLMLTTAYGGYDLVMQAYKEAVKEGYRFGTYGDAMLILKD